LFKEVIGNATLYCGDSNEILDSVDAVDSCVTDPPYGLSFMGKQWDYDVPNKELWRKVANSLKSGGHLLSFFGSRTYHRGVIPIEDAGFEIRDQLMWIYGSGFPKSYNIAKGIEGKLTHGSANWNDWNKLDGDLVDSKIGYSKMQHNQGYRDKDYSEKKHIQNVRFHTKEAQKYEGWGTALKPAHEPIVMARKPFKGSVAENVLEHGTGGINIDGCRVGTESLEYRTTSYRDAKTGEFSGQGQTNHTTGQKAVEGRFPANVMHDGSEEVLEIFPETKSGSIKEGTKQGFGNADANVYGKSVGVTTARLGSEGTASRYFYCAKASKEDRDEGLEQQEAPTENLQGLDTRGRALVREDGSKTLVERWKPNQTRKNTHPTVKPVELMKYLCRLVTPQGGVVLDPFMGSGSTGKGALLEGFKFVGIEMEREYFDIACARLEAVQKDIQPDFFA